MLNGLEAAEVKFSELERTKRVDAEFYKKENLQIEALLSNLSVESVAGVAGISDGNHFEISSRFQEQGIPYYRGQDVTGNFFIEQASAVCIDEPTFMQPYMVRSHLRKGDVLLSIVGTIGGVATVTTDEAQTCSCKLAILRPKKVDSSYLSVFLRSKFGNNRIKKFVRGTVQTGLLLEDMNQLKVPLPSNGFQQHINSLVKAAHRKLEQSKALYAEAESLLLDQLGLKDWRPSEDLAYEYKASEVLGVGRLDAEFYHPKYDQLSNSLERKFDVESIGSWGKVLKGMSVEYTDSGAGTLVIRSGDLSDIEEENRFLKASPAQEMFYLKKGDVLISSIGFGSIGKIQVFDKQGEYATVSEVTVVRQDRVNPYYLHFFLSCQAGQMQINRYITGATGQLHLYPKDVGKIIVPLVPQELEIKLENLYMQSRQLKKQSKHLLDLAKRGVEMAIEVNEQAALEWMKLSEVGSGKAEG